MDLRLLLIGIPLGSLIGIVTGLYVLLLLKDVTTIRPYARYSWMERIFGRRPGAGIRLAGRVAALPTLWFGGFFFGSWVSYIAKLGIDWAELLPVYLVMLALTFAAILAFPLIRLIMRVGRDLG